jgi:hypothetical protein
MYRLPIIVVNQIAIAVALAERTQHPRHGHFHVIIISEWCIQERIGSRYIIKKSLLLSCSPSHMLMYNGTAK